MDSTVFITNSSNPELDHLAADLCRSDELDVYVRRYANKDRFVERWLSQYAPGSALPTIGKRRLATGLDSNRVIGVGVGAEALAALGQKLPAARQWFRQNSVEWVDHAIAQRAHRELKRSSAEIVIGNYGISLEAFRVARSQGRSIILNYPISHHSFTSNFLEEEAELQPEFAQTLKLPTHSPIRVFRENAEIELAERIWLGSGFARETFISAGIPPSKLDTIPYGADLTLFHEPTEPRSTGNKITAIFAGQHTQRKGLSYLVAAAHQLRGKGVNFLLAGSNPKPEVLAKHTQYLSTLGSLDRAALSAQFGRADVFVFPTLLEGLGLVVLEAMATGLPVITTDRGPDEIVRDGVDGFLIPIRDSNALVEKLELLRDNAELRLELGRNARRRALEFSWANYGKKARASLDRVRLARRPSHSIAS